MYLESQDRRQNEKQSSFSKATLASIAQYDTTCTPEKVYRKKNRLKAEPVKQIWISAHIHHTLVVVYTGFVKSEQNCRAIRFQYT